jgi:hypothetical protein
MSSHVFALGCLEFFDERLQSTVEYAVRWTWIKEIDLNHTLMQLLDLNLFDFELAS